MKEGSTVLKVVSILMIIFAAISLLIAIAAGFVGCAAITAAGTDDSVAAAGVVAGAAGIVLLISGVFDLITGIVGLKASGRNGKNTAAFVLGIICVVLGVFGAIGSFSTGGDTLTIIVNLISSLLLPILYLYGVVQTRKGSEQTPEQ